MISPYPMDVPQRILVRFPNWIGDVVMATPLLLALRSAYPKAEISVLIVDALSQLIEADPHLNRILCFSRSPKREDLSLDFIRFLRKEKFDLSINLLTSFSSNVLLFCSSIKKRIGPKSSWISLLQSCTVPLSARHQIDRFDQLLSPLIEQRCLPIPRLFLREEEEKSSSFLREKFQLSKTNPLVLIHPGAAYGSAKSWPKESYIELARLLLKHPSSPSIVWVGSAKEAPFSSSYGKDLTGKTSMRELMILMRECTLFIGNDSGPMHMAAALGSPLIALFGSTDPLFSAPRPRSNQPIEIFWKGVSCSPCFLRKCPIDFRCMKQIGVKEVYDRAALYL